MTRLVLSAILAIAMSSITSAPLLAYVIDERAELVELSLRQFFTMRRAEQGSGGAHGRALEEIVDDASERSGTRLAARHDRCVDVALAVHAVLQMLLVDQDSQQRADRGVARRVVDLLENLRRGGFAQAVDDLHDLPLAAAETLRARHSAPANFLAPAKKLARRRRKSITCAPQLISFWLNSAA